MKFLVFGDIVENRSAFQRLAEMSLDNYNFVAFNGDLLSLKLFKELREERALEGEEPEEKRKYYKQEVEPEEIIKKYTDLAKEFVPLFKTIAQKTRLLGVWGNADHAKIISSSGVEGLVDSLHNKVLEVDGYNLVGWKGRPKYIFEDYENPTEHAFDEDEAQEELESLFKGLDNSKTILITHVPPYGIMDQVEEEYRDYAVETYGEKAEEGHIGSNALREIVEKFNPKLHIFGHIHERKGVKKRFNTTFVNTGSFGMDEEAVRVKISQGEIEISNIKV